MKNENQRTIPAAEEMQINTVVFVNEECGDIMWDRVLKEAEERANDTEKGIDLMFRY